MLSDKTNKNDKVKAKAYQNRMEYLLTNKDTLVALSRIKSGKKDENEAKQLVVAALKIQKIVRR